MAIASFAVHKISGQSLWLTIYIKPTYTPQLSSIPLKILLADDDIDDCIFFKTVIEELSVPFELTTVNDGEQLMKHLFQHSETLPDIIFLDLSMPRKNGFECLCEIKDNEVLKDIPVVMFSTSYARDPDYEESMEKKLKDIGAFHFIKKYAELSLLKKEIYNSIILASLIKK